MWTILGNMDHRIVAALWHILIHMCPPQSTHLKSMKRLLAVWLLCVLKSNQSKVVEITTHGPTLDPGTRERETVLAVDCDCLVHAHVTPNKIYLINKSPPLKRNVKDIHVLY